MVSPLDRENMRPWENQPIDVYVRQARLDWGWHIEASNQDILFLLSWTILLGPYDVEYFSRQMRQKRLDGGQWHLLCARFRDTGNTRREVR